jgi:organic radical activating enzyme
LGVVYDRDTESRRVAFDDLVAGVPDAVPLVVITGGEPLVQASRVAELAHLLVGSGRAVEVETNGTRVPPVDDERVGYNVSPKLGHAATSKDGVRPAVLQEFAALELSPVAVKFVVASEADLVEVDAAVAAAGVRPDQVWVMPEGRSAEVIVERGRALAAPTIERGYNVATRLHVLLWGDERGV